MHFKIKIACVLILFAPLILILNLHKDTVQLYIRFRRKDAVQRIYIAKITHNRTTDIATAMRFHQRFQNMYRDCWSNKPRHPSLQNTNILFYDEGRLELCIPRISGEEKWHALIWELQNGIGHQRKRHGYKEHGEIFVSRHRENTNKNASFSNWQLGVDDDFFTEPNPQTTYRVIVGRHPLARVISVWNNTMYRKNNLYENFLKRHPELYNYMSNNTLDNDYYVSWEDFGTYVSDLYVKGYEVDHLLQPITVLCQHCGHFYTYVVKYETILEDQDWLLMRFNSPSWIRLMRKESINITEETIDMVHRYMIRLPYLVVKLMYLIYDKDFLRFGYTFNMQTMKPGGFT